MKFSQDPDQEDCCNAEFCHPVYAQLGDDEGWNGEEVCICRHIDCRHRYRYLRASFIAEITLSHVFVLSAECKAEDT